MRCAVWCAAATVLLSSARLQAHEIGTTRVAVVLQQRSAYEIEIVTDAAALVEKLEALTSQPPQSEPLPRGAAILQAQLQVYDEVFRRRVVVAFDETAVQPAIDYQVSGVATATSSPAASIRMRGTVPDGARRLAWSYSWTFATYSLTVRKDGQETTEWLEGGQTSTPILLESPNRPLSRATIALRYLALGFTHILPKGLDHMLFVLGIFLLSGRLRPILWQVSAFTLAHSITLGLTLYGVISLSPSIVEPLIAVSIVYVAVENIVTSELKPWRVALVVGFGLLHGMGFAGGLRELALPRSEFLTGLVAFNAGVEAGQLTVILSAFLLIGSRARNRDSYRDLIVVPGSTAIALTGLFWTVQRLAV